MIMKHLRFYEGGNAGGGAAGPATGSEPGQNTGGTAGAGDPNPQNGADKKFTQADLDTLAASLRKEFKEKADKVTQEAKENAEKEQLLKEKKYEELYNTEKTEREKRDAEITKRDREARQLTAAAEVFKDATKAKEIAPLLMGETDDELKAHAQKLAQLFTPTAPDMTFGNGGGSGTHTGDEFDAIRKEVQSRTPSVQSNLLELNKRLGRVA